MAGRARIGTSAWMKPHWRGQFYPPGLVQRRELEYISRRLQTLEINATFHGVQRESTFLKWRDETPDDFVFAVKGTKLAMVSAPAGVKRHVAEFLESGVLQLGPKLGPVLWQFQDGQPFDPKRVELLLSLLPHEVDGIRMWHAIEVRHPSYADPRFAELVRSHGATLAITNSPGQPPLGELTSDAVYVRLHSGPDHFPAGYDDAELERWAARIHSWMTDGKDVFVYFNSPDVPSIRPPFDAQRLQDLAGS